MDRLYARTGLSTVDIDFVAHLPSHVVGDMKEIIGHWVYFKSLVGFRRMTFLVGCAFFPKNTRIKSWAHRFIKRIVFLSLHMGSTKELVSMNACFVSL